MKNEIILWLTSLILLFLIGYIKNVTDKNYPITSTFGIEGKKVTYKLDKVCFDKTSYKNIIISDIDGIEGKLILVMNGNTIEKPYRKIERGLECEIPILKPGQKINYRVILIYKDKSFEIPKAGYITLTFWGNIPTSLAALTFIFLYGGLMMSFRCLLEVFNKDKNLKKYSFITATIFLTTSSIIIPLRNSYRLGAINKFVPPIGDLIDPSLMIILFLWIVGTIFLFYKKYTKEITILITVITFVLFFFMD